MGTVFHNTRDYNIFQYIYIYILESPLAWEIKQND